MLLGQEKEVEEAIRAGQIAARLEFIPIGPNSRHRSGLTLRRSPRDLTQSSLDIVAKTRIWIFDILRQPVIHARAATTQQTLQIQPQYDISTDYDTIDTNTTQDSTRLTKTRQYDTIQYNTIRHDTIRYDTTQYSTSCEPHKQFLPAWDSVSS